ncbi:MAG: TRAP transporter small permease subunit [Chromatiales bacterium]|jgi:TRAP-type mannitol/chloroaromatic compound transport system permease small subunit
MPELDFVLPHWAYWGGLIVFPLLAFVLYRRSRTRPREGPVSLSVAYGLWLAGGFIGMHRLYLKSRWALGFIVLFVAILAVNAEGRTARQEHSNAFNGLSIAESRLGRAEKSLAKALRRLERLENDRSRDRVADARAAVADARERLAAAGAEERATGEIQDRWSRYARYLGLLLLLGMLVDAALLPRLVRRRNAIEMAPPGEEGFHCPAVEQEHDDTREPFLFNRVVSRINGFAGELVAYWSIIAVFVYYYEVVARYVFNSPTNWAHEGMFLMFGMQYLIAGGFCLRENAHVRVDVIYSQFSTRTRAVADIITSVFFFIFVLTLLTTGWVFFHDAFEVREVSFTEWGVQYWPVKFALPLGAALLLIQGVAQLVKDIAAVRNPAIPLEAETRPEG